MALPNELSKHCLLVSRNTGASKKLLGKVTVVACLVDDAESKWTEKAEKDFLELFKAALTDVATAAYKRGVDLRLHQGHCSIKLDCTCTNQSLDWVKSAAARFDRSTVADCQEIYEEKFGSDDVPMIFVLNKEFRSFASSANTDFPNWDEYSVVAKSKYGFRKSTIVHELLHQFGAVDFYYPQEIKHWAEEYLPDSIMNSGGEEIDELTEYLIGWTETPGANAVRFLRHTANFTYEDLVNANKAEWKRWS